MRLSRRGITVNKDKATKQNPQNQWAVSHRRPGQGSTTHSACANGGALRDYKWRITH